MYRSAYAKKMIPGRIPGITDTHLYLVFTELGYHDQVEYLMSNGQKQKKNNRRGKPGYSSRVMRQQQQEGTFIEYSHII